MGGIACFNCNAHNVLSLYVKGLIDREAEDNIQLQFTIDFKNTIPINTLTDKEIFYFKDNNRSPSLKSILTD